MDVYSALIDAIGVKAAMKITCARNRLNRVIFFILFVWRIVAGEVQ